MAIEVVPLHPHVGAEVRSLDLRQPVSDADFAAVEAAFNRHAVLVFPGQDLTDEQQVAFAKRFGPLEALENYTGRAKHRVTAHISDLSNLDEDGQIWDKDSDRRKFNLLGNQLWHTDSSFKRIPAMCSMLSAREIPPDGGETEFADLRAAYDALPEGTKQRIEGLVVEHSIFRSRALVGVTSFRPELLERLPPVAQMLVRRHPGSKRKTLYLASHCVKIVGWPEDEGRKLLDELTEFAVQPQFVYSHRWRVHDLVMWDNRCTMHRGRPYDDLKYKRIMHRTTVADRANTVDEAQGAHPSAA